ncbi:MAG: hypothetical protein GY870_03865, partial [archaeon]|nr:hypothetical protein [archaeon]
MIRAITITAESVETINIDELNESFIILNYWRSCNAYTINTFQATLRNKLNSIDLQALVAQRL